VHVLHRARKEGLGPAYLAGFARALELGADFIFEMDCDFSHDPADVPRLAAAAEDADLALGSRYVAGGGTRNWGLVRRFISRGGSLYAQVLLQLGIRDLTGGFKCYRRAVLETIDLGAIDSRGYAFQIETTYRAIRAGFRVVEVPITFADREVGGSKMSKSIVAEAIWKVPALRLRALTNRL
jgi:dolichol-phosphate mannosyltransferase